VVAHPKMMGGQIEKKICAEIVRRTMNKMKEILKEGWDVYPPWIWALNSLPIIMSLLVILFV